MSLFYLLRRISRNLFWRSPTLYRPIGYLRNRNNYHLRNYDLWIGGFPRSGNTYTAKTMEFLLSNGQKVISWIHLPPPIIQAVREKKPGILLVRDPRDAAVSWAIYTGRQLDQCLHYYIDFHRMLRPYLDRMLVFDFDLATGDFLKLAECFNKTYGPLLSVEKITDAMPNFIFKSIDEQSRDRHGRISERHVSRPSTERVDIAARYKAEIQNSARLQGLLDKANWYYRLFRNASPCA